MYRILKGNFSGLFVRQWFYWTRFIFHTILSIALCFRFFSLAVCLSFLSYTVSQPALFRYGIYHFYLNLDAILCDSGLCLCCAYPPHPFRSIPFRSHIVFSSPKKSFEFSRRCRRRCCCYHHRAIVIVATFRPRFRNKFTRIYLSIEFHALWAWTKWWMIWTIHTVNTKQSNIWSICCWRCMKILRGRESDYDSNKWTETGRARGWNSTHHTVFCGRRRLLVVLLWVSGFIRD